MFKYLKIKTNYSCKYIRNKKHLEKLHNIIDFLLNQICDLKFQAYEETPTYYNKGKLSCAVIIPCFEYTDALYSCAVLMIPEIGHEIDLKIYDVYHNKPHESYIIDLTHKSIKELFDVFSEKLQKKDLTIESVLTHHVLTKGSNLLYDRIAEEFLKYQKEN